MSDILTTVQAAELLHVHPKVVGAYVRKRALPAHRIGREYRFLREEIVAWVKSHGTEPKGER